MNQPPASHPVARIELLVSDWLRIGVVVSLALIVFGTALSFMHHPEYRGSGEQFRHLTSAGAGFPHDLRGIWDAARHGRGSAIVLSGLILLIATPVLRVALCLGAFILAKDPMFVLLTGLVLALLIVSFLLGKAR